MPMNSMLRAAEPARARHDPSADLALCRAQLRNGSRTFLAASLLLPRAVREPACALYAFCREADDAIDGAPPGEVGAALLGLQRRLDRIYDANDDAQPCAADRALAHVVRRHAIPRTLPDALLEGFEWDASARRYESIEDVQAYAARVAGTVGAMMALLMGAREPAAIARACDLGVAMQLSNIARDVGEDARMGRLYLPRRWLREAGIDPDAWLSRPVYTPAIGAVVARVLAVAQALYARVDAGIALLPPGCRPGINAARCLYAEIGHEVARRGLNSVDARAVVSGPRKVAVLGAALMASARMGATRRGDLRGAGEPALPATRFLVDAVAASAPPRLAPPDIASTMPGGRVVWLIDLFDRLERRERLGTRVSGS